MRLCGALLSCLLVGSLLIPQRRFNFGYIFSCLLLGALLLSAGTAILHTRGNTILAGIPLMLALGYLPGKFYKPNYSTAPCRSAKWNWKFVLFALGTGALFIYCYYFFGRVRLCVDCFPYVIPDPDNLRDNDVNIHGWISYFIGSSGHENYFMSLSGGDVAYQSVKPFHYFELWLNVFISKLFGGLYTPNLALVVYPLLTSISFTGILALWERFAKRMTYRLVLLSILILLAGALYLPFFKLLEIDNFGLPLLTYRYKMSAAYPLLIFFVLAWTSKKYLSALVALCLLPIISITFLPAIIGGVFLYTLIQLFQKPSRNSTHQFLLPLGSLLFFILFYMVFNAASPMTSSDLRADDLGRIFGNLANFNLMVKGIGHLILLYAPILFIYVWTAKKIHVPILISNFNFWSLVLCGIIAGIIAYLAFAHKFNAPQLFYNSTIALLNVMCITAGIQLYASGDHRKLISIFSSKQIIIMIWSVCALSQLPSLFIGHFSHAFTQYYSDAYLKKIDSAVNQNASMGQIGSLKDPHSYDVSAARQPVGYVLGYYLGYMKNGLAPVSLNDLDIPVNTRQEELDVQSGAFWRFVEFQKRTGNFISPERSKQQFIDQNNITGLVVAKNSRFPARNIEVISDVLSGETFYILKE